MKIFKERKSAWSLGSEIAAKRETSVITEDLVEPVEIINSKVIQEDLATSFDEVMREFEGRGLLKIEKKSLQTELEEFKKSNKEIYKKIEQLTTLGFTNTPTVKKTLTKLKHKEAIALEGIRKVKNQIKSLETIDRLTREYSLKYPTFKFIDTETFKNILTKYDLFYGETCFYSKEIPQRALDNISNFTKEIQSSKKDMCIIEETSYHSSWQNIEYYIEQKEKNLGRSLNYINIHMGVSIRNSILDFHTSCLKIAAPETHFTSPTINKRSNSSFRESKDVEISLLDFNKTTREIQVTTEHLEKHEANRREVLDPIAFLEVEGGVIILDAWDEEADIPEIQNTFNN